MEAFRHHEGNDSFGTQINFLLMENQNALLLML